MTQHNHSERVDGCFRCDLSADEVRQTGDSDLSIPERSTAEEVDVARRKALAATQVQIDDARWMAAYWEHTALGCRRVWFYPRSWRVYLGGDEYERRTLVLGPLVIALWRTKECRERLAELDEHLRSVALDEYERTGSIGDDDGLTDSQRQCLAQDYMTCEGSAMTAEQYRQAKELP